MWLQNYYFFLTYASARAFFRNFSFLFAYVKIFLYLCSAKVRNMAEQQPHIPQSSIEIYTAPDNSIQLQVKLEQDTVWLTQKQLADLFGVKKAAISKHVSNIFAVGELDPSMTVSKMETVVNRGFRGVVKDWVDYYNLDMILSIGYRVNSRRAISFRQWANKVLKDYLVKGYAVRSSNKRIAARSSFGSWTGTVSSIRRKETNA